MPVKNSKQLLKGLANKDPRAIAKAMESETPDWIFEILRPHFIKQLQAQTAPPCSAKQLIEKTLQR